MKTYFKQFGRLALITFALIVAFLAFFYSYGKISACDPVAFPVWVKALSGVLLWFIIAGISLIAIKPWHIPRKTSLSFAWASLIAIFSGILASRLVQYYLTAFEKQTADVCFWVWTGVFVAAISAAQIFYSYKETNELKEAILLSKLEDAFFKFFKERLEGLGLTAETHRFKDKDLVIVIHLNEINDAQSGKNDSDDQSSSDDSGSPQDTGETESDKPRFTGGHMTLDA